MYKITSSLAAIFLALSAGSPMAADLPSAKAPTFIPPPPPLWTGFYFGANVGGIFDANTGASISASPFFNDTTGAALGAPSYFGTASAASIANNASLSNTGVIGGGQVGYNWQFNNSFLVGLEADIQGTTLSSYASASGAAAEPSTGSLVSTTASLTKSLSYLGTVRGRLGFLATPNSFGVRLGRPRLWRHEFHRRSFPEHRPIRISRIARFRPTTTTRASAGPQAAASNGCSFRTGAPRSNIFITTLARPAPPMCFRPPFQRATCFTGPPTRPRPILTGRSSASG